MKIEFRKVGIMAITALTLMVSVTACKSKEKAAERERPQDEVLVNVYCSGEDYFSNNKFFRANAVGESMDQSTSKKKSMSNAKADLASAIQTTIKGTIDNYVNSREVNNVEELAERFEGLTREVINQELIGTKTICEKVTKTASGTYKTYIAIELSGDEMVGKMNERLSKDDLLKVDYDYEKFKDTFNEEMKKLENR
tara:strand:+ start:1340 stop:1930 length:591 start_codon:yes stop_codon:yes gene_type:complete